MNAAIQYLLVNIAVPAATVLAILRGFSDKIFGHVLDRRLQTEKERHELALANLPRAAQARATATRSCGWLFISQRAPSALTRLARLPTRRRAAARAQRRLFHLARPAGCEPARGPGESYSDVILRLAKGDGEP